MILAVSRFRVANGTESDVVAAFLKRPRLVESWPGFLGLETFVDVKDAALFYLVTRWTDAAAFRAWHSSPAHRASHAWMPAGLRLDPSDTRLVELERLLVPEGTDVFNLVMDAAALIGRFLEGTRVVHVVRLDLDGTVRFANRALSELLGVDEAGFLGRAIFPHLTQSDAERLRQILSGEQAAEQTLPLNFCDFEGNPLTLSCVLRRTPEDCLILGEPAFDDERLLQRQLIAANQDLANLARERHRAAGAERAARRAAELANQTKDAALAVIAHELRQPLHAASIALGMLTSRPDGLDRFRGVLERQLNAMTKIVEDLLDASRVLRGSIELLRQRLDLRDLAEQATESIRADAAARQQRVSLSQPPDPVPVDVDPVRFGQVLSNVLTNAIKYTPPGGSIAVAVERGPTQGVVRVSDSGTGLAPEALERLFDLFARSSAEPGGLGIGLAVAKRLIEMHGGSIAVRSDGIGRGSEFVLGWPLADPVPPARATDVPNDR